MNEDYAHKDYEKKTSSISSQKRKKIIRKIQAMSLAEVQSMLIELEKDVNGSKKDQYSRLRSLCLNQEYALTLLLNRDISIKCPFKYIFVIDFEATCDEPRTFYPHEIIEFPAVLIDTDELKIVDTFHSFVRPVLNPVITEFCTSLTGVTQEIVDKSDIFCNVLDAFIAWKTKYVKLDHSYAILTDGPYDMKRFLALQCILSQIQYPSFGKRWINIKELFSEAYTGKKLSLTRMLSFFDKEFEGTLHSGKDDAHNIALLTLEMLKDSVRFGVNERITMDNIKLQSRLLYSYLGKSFPPVKISPSSKKALKSRHAEEKHVQEKLAADKLVEDENASLLLSECDVDPEIRGTEFILLRYKNRKI